MSIFEIIYLLANRLREDTPNAYAAGLRSYIQKYGYNNLINFNNARISIDNKIAFGGNNHIGQENMPIADNFCDLVLDYWENKWPNDNLTFDQKQIIRNISLDYYNRKIIK